MQVHEMLKGTGSILERKKTFQHTSRQEDISQKVNLLLDLHSPKCKDDPNYQQNQAELGKYNVNPLLQWRSLMWSEHSGQTSHCHGAVGIHNTHVGLLMFYSTITDWITASRWEIKMTSAGNQVLTGLAGFFSDVEWITYVLDRTLFCLSVSRN